MKRAKRPSANWIGWNPCPACRRSRASFATMWIGCSTCRGLSDSQDRLDVKHADLVLERRHFGLPKAKERILEYIAVRKLAGERTRSPILCFVGPPGTGKTSLGASSPNLWGANSCA